jgi:hypothetical protein
MIIPINLRWNALGVAINGLIYLSGKHRQKLLIALPVANPMKPPGSLYNIAKISFLKMVLIMDIMYSPARHLGRA